MILEHVGILVGVAGLLALDCEPASVDKKKSRGCRDKLRLVEWARAHPHFKPDLDLCIRLYRLDLASAADILICCLTMPS
jgi:hypothetical protein